MTLAELNALPPGQAQAELGRCCSSAAWAGAMAASRPFMSLDALAAIADRTWDGLDPADWLDAFAGHPPIGATEASGWSAAEQSRVATAGPVVRERLAHGNLAYRERFGYTFLIWATGKSADEIVAELEARLGNAPEVELRVAAGELRKITQLRLRKLLA